MLKKTPKGKVRSSKAQAVLGKSRGDDLLRQHRFWLARATEVAEGAVSQGGSPHPHVKVGAVIVDAKGREVAAASNRFASGVDRRRPERYDDKERSLWINCAEQMALMDALRAKASLEKAKLYVTLEPCAVCAGLIAEAGIKEVIIPVGARRHYAKLKKKWKLSIEIGHVKLTEAGVKVTAVDTDLGI